jgi:hypothetical protein
MRTALLLVILAACSKQSEPPPLPSTTTTTTTATATSTATSTAISDVAWDVPSGWQTVPNPKTFRKATYTIPKAAGDSEDAELTVSQVGGTVDENIDRWAGQFGGQKSAVSRAEQKVGPLKVTVVTLEGKYTGGMTAAAQPKEGYALLAAIVEPVEPPYFFKMTGPKKTVNAARADFDRLVKSLRPK